MDEHRVGLQPTTRRRWSPKGERVIERVKPGYKWLYIWAWLRPATGELEAWVSDKVDTAHHNALMDKVAKSLGLGAKRRLLLVVDSAGWHTSNDLIIPEGIELFFLPPRTPELQPVERLWTLTDEPLVGLATDDLSLVERLLSQRICSLASRPHLLHAHSYFHWWPERPHSI